MFVADFFRHVRSSLVCGAMVLCVTMNTGCSVTGSWKRVSVDPPGVPFPIDTVTFEANKNYTASWSEKGSPRTSSGIFTWNGSTLKIQQFGSQPRTYRARRRFDGKLELTYEKGNAKATAILERMGQDGETVE